VRKGCGCGGQREKRAGEGVCSETVKCPSLPAMRSGPVRESERAEGGEDTWGIDSPDLPLLCGPGAWNGKGLGGKLLALLGFAWPWLAGLAGCLASWRDGLDEFVMDEESGALRFWVVAVIGKVGPQRLFFSSEGGARARHMSWTL
jgi:hypothetical protein